MLSQCFAGSKVFLESLYSSNCNNDLAEGIDELYAPKIPLLDAMIDRTLQSTKICSTLFDGRVTEEAEPVDKRTVLFTPNRLGFARLQNKHI